MSATKNYLDPIEQITEAFNTDDLGLWQLIADTMPQMVWTTLPNGHYQFFNRPCCNYTGLPPQQLKSEGWANFVHPEDQPHASELWTHSLQTGDPYEIEYRFKRYDGQYRWFLGRALPLRDKNGQIINWFGTSTDIHDQKLLEQQLKLSNERYNLVTQATNDVIWDWDILSNNVWRNDNYQQIFGYKDEGPDTTVDMWKSKIHPDDRDWVFQSILELMDKGKKYWTAEYRYQKKDGSYAVVLERAFVIYDTQGKPSRMLGSMQNITERRNHEELLAQKDRNIRRLIQHAPVAISVFKGEDLVMDIVNEHMIQLVGKREHVIGKSLFDVFPSLKDQPIVDIVYNVLHTGKPYYGKEIIVSIENEDGLQGRYFNFAFTPVIENNTIVGVMNVAIEVTEQVNGRKLIEESNKELQFVMDVIPSMVWHTQPDGAADFFNKAYLDYTGLPMEQLVGFQYAALIHPDDMPPLTKVYDHAFANATAFEIEHRLLGKDGAYRWFLTRSIPRKDENGRIIKWYGTTTDIQEQKTTSEELEQRVNDRTWELELRNKDLEQFTHVSHHDMQEPLRKILTFSDMLRHDSYDKLTDASKYWLNKISEAALRMKTVLTDVLNFTSLNKEDQLEVVALNDVLAAVKCDLELMIAEKNAMIYAEDLPTVTAIRSQIYQLFYNLLNNALKYAKAGQPPAIYITYKTLSASEVKQQPHLDHSKHYYEITVKDNGIGFDQENATKIFEIFKRLHSKSAYEGTGIGLALCRKIALNHNGDISAYSKEGEGATFKILLPAG